MTTFPRTRAVPFARTRAAAGYALQHAPSQIARARAAMLLDQAARCEAALAAGQGPPAAYGLLRAMVLTVRELTGTGWLDASAGDPAVDAFTALQAAPAPPGPASLDETLAGVIWARFAPYGTSPGDRPVADTPLPADEPAGSPAGPLPAGKTGRV